MIDENDLQKIKDLQRQMKDKINIDPLQSGGILTEKGHKALLEWGSGYSVCDFCKGRLDKIENPPISYFVGKLLPEFLGADVARVTNGAREGMFSITHSLKDRGEYVLLDENAHYSSYLAAERSGLEVVEVPNSGEPRYEVEPEGYKEKIEEVGSEDIALAFLTYPDGNYGNYVDAEKVADITNSYDIPFLLNGAYTVGRKPISMNEIGADFIVGSGHKSMAASGPVGVLGMKEKWKDVVLRKSQYSEKKEEELMGCTARGATVMTLISSFPEVTDRVKEWDQQVEKAQWFIEEAEKLGLEQLGEKPHRHDLIFFKADPFYEISQEEGRFFLYKELKKRDIWGIKPGLTKQFKVSTFAASRDELRKVIDAFSDIIDKYS